MCPGCKAEGIITVIANQIQQLHENIRTEATVGSKLTISRGTM